MARASTQHSAISSQLWAIGCLALLLLPGCATPAAYVEPAPLAATDRRTLNLQVYDHACELIGKKYFDPDFRGVDWPAARAKYRPVAEAAASDAELYRALDRLCAELKESHLTALPPRRTHEIRTARRMAVGMGWANLEGRQVVTELIPGGPADQAGVQAGWIITACEGRPMGDGAPFSPAPGRPVTYGFINLKNEPQEITFQPQLLRFDQLVSRELPGGHRYLRFDKFDQESMHWLSRQLKDHRDAPGVVIDLRDNPGGLLFTLRFAVAEFFDHRVATGQFVRRSGRVSSPHGLPFFSARYPGKVVVLTSGATGSAAEIFSHVLQHQGRATIVGRRTAGAVIVSRTYALPGGGTLQVPIQDYRGLDGRRLEGRGVTPDIAVAEAGLADLRTGRDPDLETALTSLGSPMDRKGTLTAATGTSPAGTGSREIGLP